MKKLTKADLKAFRDRLYLPIPDAALDGRPAAVLPPGREVRRDPVHAGAAGRARRLRCRKRVVRGQAARRCPATTVYAELRDGLGQAAGRHHDGVRPAAQGPDEGQGDRPALRADHPGRGPHLRHGRDLPDGQDLLAARAGVRRRSTATCCCPTRSRKTGQILHEGISEAGSMALVHRRRHVVRDARRADDPVLHLLLDVRVPAHRRPVLGSSPTSSAAASCSAPPRAAPR